jgi:hypothetical protein
MGRVAAACVVAALLGSVAGRDAAAANPTPRVVRVFSDADDDDDDGVADRSETRLDGAAASDVVWLDALQSTQLARVEGDAVRVISGDRPVRAPAKLGAHAGLQGMLAGVARLEAGSTLVEARVVELVARDAAGRKVDLATSHASITRSLPTALAPDRPASDVDPDALRWLAIGPEGSLPETIGIASSRPGGEPLDRLDDVALAPVACPSGAGAGLVCRESTAVRATSDLIDRSHPESSARSLRAEVGGRLRILVDGKKVSSIRIGGPRDSSLGPLERYRAKLRVRVVRLSARGSAPIGGSDAAALALAREEVRTASSLWGQCGIHFGASADVDVALVDPPPPHLIAIGCDLGLPATGGEIAFGVGGKTVSVRTEPGQTPAQVAALVAAAVRRSGFSATLSGNARISPGASRTFDVLVRRHDGSMVPLGPAPKRDEARLSTDATLDACLGEVDLADGLTHFTDFDAVAGTVEERSLIKAFDDGDPTTIEVFIIPAFARSGRIGESFIFADGSSIRNVVILDRAGIRAGARSFALAHELGHILLDMPGHPDDYGVDQPSSLMDADAADPSIFGPRRLTVAECERAVRQSGPSAPVTILNPWPLYRR